MRNGRAHRFPVGMPCVLLSATLAVCGPVEGDPPDLADVEDHLGLVVDCLPEGRDPIGLGGDGRGRILGAGFDCGEGTGLRIERFDADSIDAQVSSSPAETAPGRSSGVMRRPAMRSGSAPKI
jgi:hypothetical protein